jgi:hypothetical protein
MGWYSVERSSNGGTGGTTTTGTIVSLGTVTNFSPFTLASTSLSNPLPVELIDFNVIKKMDVAEISWTTKTENNNDYFTIQRSMDGINFTDLKSIDGAGNSNSKIDYLWIDESCGYCSLLCAKVSIKISKHCWSNHQVQKKLKNSCPGKVLLKLISE